MPRWAIQAVPPLPSLSADNAQALSTVRLWAILKRFFKTPADLIESDN